MEAASTPLLYALISEGSRLIRPRKLGANPMKILTIPDGLTWLREHGLPEDRGALEIQGLPLSETYRLPADCGRKTALARLIAEVIKESSTSAVVRITGCGVWGIK
jgi:hypothetical protein